MLEDFSRTDGRSKFKIRRCRRSCAAPKQWTAGAFHMRASGSPARPEPPLREQRSLRQGIMGDQPALQHPGAERHHDVVDRAVVGVLDRFTPARPSGTR